MMNLVYEHDGKNVEFTYNDTPTIVQKIAIVNNVADGVVSEIVGYNPVLKNYLFCEEIISSLTNIELPNDLNESVEFIVSHKLDEKIRDANIAFWDELYECAEEKIRFNVEKEIKKSKLDDLADAITAIISKYESLFDGIDLSDFYDKLSVLSNIATIPEEKLVQGIIEHHDFDKKNKEDNIIALKNNSNETDK